MIRVKILSIKEDDAFFASPFQTALEGATGQADEDELICREDGTYGGFIGLDEPIEGHTLLVVHRVKLEILKDENQDEA